MIKYEKQDQGYLAVASYYLLAITPLTTLTNTFGTVGSWLKGLSYLTCFTCITRVNDLQIDCEWGSFWHKSKKPDKNNCTAVF